YFDFSSSFAYFLYCCCFFFYGDVDSRDLLSFPTRRSSDLSASLAILVAQIEKAHVSESARIGRALAKFNLGQKFIYLVDEDIDIDRKSTRLNSSHVEISYAVFCLKKKKNRKSRRRRESVTM